VKSALEPDFLEPRGEKKKHYFKHSNNWNYLHLTSAGTNKQFYNTNNLKNKNNNLILFFPVKHLDN